MIVSGTSSQALAAELAAETGRELAGVSVEQFPDGERYLRVDGIDEGADAIIVASTDSDGAHVELLQLQDAVREAGATEITTVIPYLGYMRQERAFNPGEPASARAVARAISTGTDRVLTVNPHEAGVCEYFDVPTTAVDAAPLLATPLSDLIDPLFLAPDAGARDLARTVRDAYGAGEIDHFEKTRHSGTDVEIEPSDASVTDRDAVLVDDMVATGSTMSESVSMLATHNPEHIMVACIHPVFARTAYLRLKRAGVTDIYATDTLSHYASRVSVAPAIANEL